MKASDLIENDDAQTQPFNCVKASDLIENDDAQPQPFNCVKASDLIENGEFDISAIIDTIDIAPTVFRQAEAILRDYRPEVIHVFVNTRRSEACE